MWMALMACSVPATWWTESPEVAVPSVVPPLQGDGLIREATVIAVPEAMPELGPLPPLHAMEGGRNLFLLERADLPWRAEALDLAQRDPAWLSLLSGGFHDESSCTEAIQRFSATDDLWRALYRCPIRLQNQVRDAVGLLLPPLGDDTDVLLIEQELDPFLLVEDYGDAAIPALAACGRDPDIVSLPCTRALAKRDWAQAQRIALARSGDWMGWTNPQAALARFDSADALGRHLDDLGFFGPAAHGTPLDQLEERGWLWRPTFAYPEVQLGRLLAMVGIHDVMIDSYYATLTDLTVLTVWHGGRRLRLLTAGAPGADPEQLVGLANRMAREADLPLRAVLVDDPVLGACAVTGTASGLQALVDEGLVVPLEPIERPPLHPPVDDEVL